MKNFIRNHIDTIVPFSFFLSIIVIFMFFNIKEHNKKLDTYYAYPKEIVIYEDVKNQPSKDCNPKDCNPQSLLERIVDKYSEFGYVETFVEVDPGIYKIVIHKYDRYNR